jgi:tRNA uridine 5-carbamoylmethylation protein Kti12
MKLVILYGPPAGGKLTIAQNLAKIADIHVFDNHQVIDMIEPIVTRKYPNFSELIYQTQQNILEAAVKANQTNVVMTFPYASSLDRDVEFITELATTSRKLGAEVYPIFLKCSNETLLKRVLEPSRKAYGKITTTEVMNTMIEMHNFDEPAPVEGNVIINTDQVSANDAALQIKKLIEL